MYVRLVVGYERLNAAMFAVDFIIADLVPKSTASEVIDPGCCRVEERVSRNSIPASRS